MKTAILFLSVFLAVGPALAKDLVDDTPALSLYPNSREAYDRKFHDRAEQYEVSARNYVDDLYENHAEGGAAASESLLPEKTLDAVLDSADKQTVKAAGNAPDTMPPAMKNRVSDIPPVNTSPSPATAQ